MLPVLISSFIKKHKTTSSGTLADGCSCRNQLVVGSCQRHELVVGSLLNQDAPRHDGDDVRVLDGGQAMGDDDAGPALSGFVQGFLDGLSKSWEYSYSDVPQSNELLYTFNDPYFLLLYERYTMFQLFLVNSQKL